MITAAVSVLELKAGKEEEKLEESAWSVELISTGLCIVCVVYAFS